MNNFSNAQIIKQLYKELLSDGAEHSRTELFDYVKANSEKEFTNAMLTGALRTLVTGSEDYISPRRSYYREKKPADFSENKTSLISKYAEILEETLKESKHIICDPFEIIKMSDDDKAKMEHIENCFNAITQTLKLIQD